MKEVKGYFISEKKYFFKDKIYGYVQININIELEGSINPFKEGDILLIKKYSKPRSTGKKSQNNHFQGHCRQIAEHTGNDFKSTKLGIMVRAFEDMNLESLMKKAKKGDKEYYYLKDESELDSFECSQLIEMAHLVAGELGIILKEGWE